MCCAEREVRSKERASHAQLLKISPEVSEGRSDTSATGMDATLIRIRMSGGHPSKGEASF